MLINQIPAQLRLNVMSTQFTINMVIFSFHFYCDNFAFLLFLWNFPKTFGSQLQSSKGFVLQGYKASSGGIFKFFYFSH